MSTDFSLMHEGVVIPPDVEAAGADAILAYVAAQRAPASPSPEAAPSAVGPAPEDT